MAFILKFPSAGCVCGLSLKPLGCNLSPLRLAKSPQCQCKHSTRHLSLSGSIHTHTVHTNTQVELHKAYKQENKNWGILKIFPNLQHSGSLAIWNVKLMPHSCSSKVDLCLTQHRKTLPKAVGEDGFHNQYPWEQVNKKRPASDKWAALSRKRAWLFIIVSPGANV